MLRSTPLWFPAPIPRLARVVTKDWLYVKVPLTVMLPLGPDIVELYLRFGVTVRTWKQRVDQTLTLQDNR